MCAGEYAVMFPPTTDNQTGIFRRVEGLPIQRRLKSCWIGALFLLSAIPGFAGTRLLHYSFDEGSGTVTEDVSGSAPEAPGQLMGNAGWTEATPRASGHALNISSGESGDYVDSGPVEKLAGLTQFTVTLWINLQGAPNSLDRILSTSEQGSFGGFDLHIVKPLNGNLAPSNFSLGLAVNGNVDSAVTVASEGMNADMSWVFVAVTYDGTLEADNVNFYAGSSSKPSYLLDSRSRSISSGPVSQSIGSLRIGSTGASRQDRTPPAYIDEVQIFEGVLSLSQIDVIRKAALQ